MPEIRFWDYLAGSPVSTTYEFNTEVMSAIKGEQRVSLRKTPRVYYDLTFLMDEAQLDSARTLLRAQMSETDEAYRNKLYMPRYDLGHTGVIAEDPVNINRQIIETNTDNWETYLKEHIDWCLAIDQDLIQWKVGTPEPALVDEFFFNPDVLSSVYADPQILTNVTTSGDTIGYLTTSTHNYTVVPEPQFTSGSIKVNALTDLSAYVGKNCTVYPSEVVRIVAPPSIERAGYNNNRVTLRVQSLTYEYSEYLDYTFQLQDSTLYPILDRSPISTTPLSETLVFPEVVVDFGTGPISYEKMSFDLDDISSRTFDIGSQEDYYFFRVFSERLAGRKNKFAAVETYNGVSSYDAFRLDNDSITFVMGSGDQGRTNLTFKKIESEFE